jgi:hypothetical protein
LDKEVVDKIREQKKKENISRWLEHTLSSKIIQFKGMLKNKIELGLTMHGLL